MSSPISLFQRVTSADNAAAVVTVVASGANDRVVIRSIIWSYSAVPASGRLTVDDGVTKKIEFDIRAMGADQLNLDRLQFTPGANVVITLAAGGTAGDIGMLNVEVSRKK